MTRDALTVSLNEFGFLAARAATCVGVPLGLAEDFAAALRRTACFGLDPAALGLSCLTALDADPSRGKIAISKRGDRMTIHGNDPVSAVFAGVSMTDFWRAGKADNRRILARSVDCPALVLGYAAHCAAGADMAPLRIAWPGVRATLRGNGVVAIALSAADALTASGPADMRFGAPDEAAARGGAPLGKEIKIDASQRRLFAEGIAVDAAAWAGLTDLFRRCLVPSDARSREAGAGAGLTDAD